MARLTLTVQVRDHNRRLMLALMSVLAVLSRVLPGRAVVWLGNSILRLYWYEYRIEHGPWRRGDHRLTIEYSA